MEDPLVLFQKKLDIRAKDTKPIYDDYSPTMQTRINDAVSDAKHAIYKDLAKLLHESLVGDKSDIEERDRWKDMDDEE